MAQIRIDDDRVLLRVRGNARQLQVAADTGEAASTVLLKLTVG